MSIYHFSKTYQENLEQGPLTPKEIPQRDWRDRSTWETFLGFPLASKIGVPAGPLLNSSWIALARDLGFDFLTYKTIRSHKHPCHEAPNIIPVDCPSSLQLTSLPEKLFRKANFPENLESFGITNSFGNPSMSPQYLEEDIAKSRDLLYEGQVLAVSVFGTGQTLLKVTQDYVKTALFARKYGAHIIEANLSCPNIVGGKAPLYQDTEALYSIATSLKQALSDTPLIIKLGTFLKESSLENTLELCEKAHVDAVCGINTIQMEVVNDDHTAALGEERRRAGICGAPIRESALDFIKKAKKIIYEKNYSLKLLGTGGVTKPHHFQEFLDAGADLSLVATGMLFDPFIGLKYHKEPYVQ